DLIVTGVQTCALPISQCESVHSGMVVYCRASDCKPVQSTLNAKFPLPTESTAVGSAARMCGVCRASVATRLGRVSEAAPAKFGQIGRASCRERVESGV